MSHKGYTSNICYTYSWPCSSIQDMGHTYSTCIIVTTTAAHFMWWEWGMKFHENYSNGSPDTAEKVHSCPSKVPSLLTDGNQTFIICNTSMEGVRCKLPWKSLWWKPRYSRKGNWSSKWSAITKPTLVLAHSWTVYGMKFQQKPRCSGKWTSFFQLSALHFRLLATKITTFGVYV